MTPTIIDRIQANNIKGRNLDHQLAPITAIVGANATGKTAVRDAITIALLGYSPHLGKKPSATVELMTTGATMLDVKASFSNGTHTNRRWDVKKAIKASLDGVDMSADLNEIQFDFEQFTQAKPTERQRVLESLMDSTAGAEVVEEARLKIAESGLDLHIQFDSQGGKPVDGWLQKLEAEAKEEAKLSDQEVKTASATLLQLSATSAPVAFDAAALTKAESDKETADRKLGEAQERSRSIAERIENTPDKPDGEPVTESFVNARRADKAVAEKALQDHDTAMAEFNAAKREVNSIMGHYPDAIAAVDHSDVRFPDGLDDTLKAAQEADRQAATDVASARSTVVGLEQQWQTLTTKVNGLKAAHQCPTCGTKGDNFADAVQKLYDPEFAELDGKLTKARDEQTRLQGIQDGTFEQVQKLTLLLRQRSEHHRFRAERRCEEILRGAPEPTTDRAKLDRAVKDATEAVQEAEADLADWQAFNNFKTPSREEVTQAAEDLREAQEASVTLAGVIADLKTRQGAYEQALADVRRKTELETEVKTKTEASKAAKNLATWAKAKSLEVTAAAMKPILGICDVVLKDLIDGNLAIVGTEVGIQADAGFRSLKVISGSEAIAVSGALQIGLAQKSPIRMVMIDELARFDANRVPVFLRNLRTAKDQGLVDQILVFSHSPVGDLADVTILTD